MRSKGKRMRPASGGKRGRSGAKLTVRRRARVMLKVDERAILRQIMQ